MQKAIKAYLDQFEKEAPHHREKNDRSTEDLFIRGGREVSPGRPFAIEVGHRLEGGDHNRKRYHHNYDNILHPEHQKEYDDHFQDLSEKAAMLHDPMFILDDSDEENISEDRKTARDMMHHIAENTSPEEMTPAMLQEIYHPMLNLLMDRLVEAESTIGKLSEAMVKGTRHLPKDYFMRFNSSILHPAVHNRKDRWNHRINKHFGGKHG